MGRIISRKVCFLCFQCLSSTTAFSFGSQYLSRYEEQMVGLHWKNIHESPMEGDDLSFSFACTMMAIDSLIYFVIGWYVKSVKKSKFTLVFLFKTQRN